MHLVNWFGKWWSRSIRHRLLVLNIIVVVVFLVLIGYLSLNIGRTGVQNEVNQRNNQLAMHVAQDLKAHFDNILSNMRLFTYQLKPFTNMLSLPLQARAMLEFRRISPLIYRALYLFDSEGDLLIHLADPLEDLLAVQDVTEIINRPPILLTDDILVAYKAARNGNVFLSPTYIIGLEQVPIVYMGIPITAKDRGSSQIVVAEIDLRNIWLKVDKIHIGQTGRVFVVSQEGTIIAHPDRVYIGRQLAPELKPVLSGYEGRTAYTDPISGARLLASYSPLGGQSGWGIVVEQEQTEVLAPVNRIASITLGVLVLAISMATIATILVAQSITLPLQHLAEASRRITQTGDLSQQVRVEGQDEVSQLATMFNQMTASLQRAEKDLRKYSENLEEMVDERTKELRDAQEQLVRSEKLAVLGQLAGGVGHELRNPLGSIKNAAYFLKMALEKPEPEVEETLEILNKEVATSEHIISSLLDFARPNPPIRHKMNINDLAQEVLSRTNLPENIKVVSKLDKSLPQILADPEQLSQVFGNLILNAIQAMPDGGQLEVRSEVSPPAQVAISFADTGVGIPEDNLKKLFEPLFTTKAKGIGLGLAITKTLVEKHGGTIEVQSQPGKGSAFTVRLPIKGKEED